MGEEEFHLSKHDSLSIHKKLKKSFLRGLS